MSQAASAATSTIGAGDIRDLNRPRTIHVDIDEILVPKTTAIFIMSRPFFIVPIVGCLVLALAASAPGVVADILGSRGGWHTAYEMVTEQPRCWGLPGFTYCRTDHRHTTATGSESGSLHSITVSPLPRYVRMLRSDLLPSHLTTLTALDHLRERCLIVIGLLGLLAFFLWPLVVALFRGIKRAEDPEARLAAAGWRVTPEETLLPARQRMQQPHDRSFGRRR